MILANQERQKARVAFVEWVALGIGSRQWGELAVTYGWDTGSFHHFMQGKRTLPARVWERMCQPGRGFMRLMTPEKRAEGQRLWEATQHVVSTHATTVLTSVDPVRKHLAEMRKSLTWLNSNVTNPQKIGIAVDELFEELEELEALIKQKPD